MDIQVGPLLILWVLPLIINYRLAKKQKKNIAFILLLTLCFSWVITIALFSVQLLFQMGDTEYLDRICPKCNRPFRNEDDSCFLCGIRKQLTHGSTSLRRGKACVNCHRVNRMEDDTCFACGHHL